MHVVGFVNRGPESTYILNSSPSLSEPSQPQVVFPRNQLVMYLEVAPSTREIGTKDDSHILFPNLVHIPRPVTYCRKASSPFQIRSPSYVTTSGTATTKKIRRENKIKGKAGERRFSSSTARLVGFPSRETVAQTDNGKGGMFAVGEKSFLVRLQANSAKSTQQQHHAPSTALA